MCLVLFRGSGETTKYCGKFSDGLTFFPKYLIIGGGVCYRHTSHTVRLKASRWGICAKGYRYVVKKKLPVTRAKNIRYLAHISYLEYVSLSLVLNT